MMLAGVPVQPDAVAELATTVRAIGGDELADRLDRARADGVALLALTLEDTTMSVVNTDVGRIRAVDPPLGAPLSPKCVAAPPEKHGGTLGRTGSLCVAAPGEPVDGALSGMGGRRAIRRGYVL